MNLTPIFAAGNSWESLLVVVGLVLISAISNWLTKKRASEESETWPAEENSLPIPRPRPPAQPPIPRTAPAPPPAKRLDWEDELRRLLGEDDPASPPPMPVPRPPPKTAPPALAPKQVKLPPAPVVTRTPPPFEIPSVLQSIDVENSPNLELSHRDWELAQMEESRRAYQIGTRLPGQVAEQMRQADERVERHTAGRRPRASSDNTELLAMLRQRHTARQAFIASLVFGPPKGFEGGNDRQQ